MSFEFAIQVFSLFYMGIQERSRNYTSSVAAVYPQIQSQHFNKPPA